MKLCSFEGCDKPLLANGLEMLARQDYEAEIARLQLRIVELEAKLEMESACA